VRLWPKSLAGQLAALLVLTLIAAQVVTFMLFAGERISAFRMAYQENLLLRVCRCGAARGAAGAAPRLVATSSHAQFRIALAPKPAVGPNPKSIASLRDALPPRC
jgi:hypothetical protein